MIFPFTYNMQRINILLIVIQKTNLPFLHKESVVKTAMAKAEVSEDNSNSTI